MNKWIKTFIVITLGSLLYGVFVYAVGQGNAALASLLSPFGILVGIGLGIYCIVEYELFDWY